MFFTKSKFSEGKQKQINILYNLVDTSLHKILSKIQNKSMLCLNLFFHKKQI